MANTFELISTTTLTGSAASITLSSIPATFTDIQIVLSGRTDASPGLVEGVVMALNASSSNFTVRELIAYNGGGYSQAVSTGRVGVTSAAGSTSNTFGSMNIYIPNYALATNKSFSSEYAAETNGTFDFNMGIIAGLWSNTAAITSVTFTPDGGHNFVAGSTASIYGILKGSGGATVS